MATTGEMQKRWTPRGVSDTIEGDNAPAGAMASLQNLIHDPATPGVFICRPANIKEIDFTAWGAAPGTTGVITAAYQVGNIIYGMVGITTGAYAGLDYPFAYNVNTEAFLVTTGITVAKCPTSQATSGAWTPPQISAMGVFLVITHVGYDGVTHFFGSFDITVPTAPVYNALNTATNGLPSVPQALGGFNNRTYFMCGSVSYYTDTLALKMTNSNQSQTVGDSTAVTAVAPLPVSTTSQSIIQGLILFKLTQMYLLTGDVTGGTLGLNQLSNSVGTGAPRSAVSTPDGVRFMANDGARMVNFLGIVSEPDSDVAVPFINALVPSRVCAAFNADIYRICVQNAVVSGTPYQDYWYNSKRRAWSGPHTFRYDIAVPLQNDFMLASNSLVSSMWHSYTVQNHAGAGVTFTENGTALSWQYTTPPMQDIDGVYANCLLRAAIEIAAPASGQTYNWIAQDESNSPLALGSIVENLLQSVWNAFTWGASNWGAAATGLIPITIPFTTDAVFNRLSIAGSGPSSLALKLGSLHLAYKKLKYLLY